jgi:hypothetical protein
VAGGHGPVRSGTAWPPVVDDAGLCDFTLLGAAELAEAFGLAAAQACPCLHGVKPDQNTVNWSRRAEPTPAGADIAPQAHLTCLLNSYGAKWHLPAAGANRRK